MHKTKLASLSTQEVLRELNSSVTGLSQAEASSRLTKYGPNILKSESRRSVLTLLIKQFKSSLIYLLIVASILSFSLKDYNDGIVIAVILLINTGLGFYQEFKSEKAVEKLQKLVDKQILVVREGLQILVSEKSLVTGDVVVLKEGDIVPADIRLINVDDVSVNESQLTGESEPVTKKTDGQAALVYAGSTMEQGEAKGVVFATSQNTELGKIAHLSSSTKRVTEFEKSLSVFSNFLVRFTFITLVAVFVLKLITVHSTAHIGDLLLFIIALSIAVVPEAMPVIVTVTLSRGALDLAKKHVIAKTLTAVEDLGNINVLCSDKTGTLTENKLTVKQLTAPDPHLFQRLAIASLESLDEKRKKFQSSFDQAFLAYVPADIQQEVHHFARLEELPFDPAARRRRVVCRDGNKTYLIEVGSVETLLELTKHDKQKAYTKLLTEDGKQGLRHLGIAYKEVHYTDDSFDILKHEDGLHFVGFVALEDPLRDSAKHTIALAEKLGVTIKILSGDSREVTHYVASEVGLINKTDTVYTGDEIDAMSDEKLESVAKISNAFARLNPEQKYRIIKLLKAEGNVVGYQGDGINDAPSLKLADVAIAVSNATDVAQESADILLLRNDLNVIVNGIMGGRQIFANINKYIRYTLIGNYGNFFALSALYLLANSALPILPVQVLLSNLLTDVPLITIATDNVDPTSLLSPSRFRFHALMFLSLLLGTVTAIFEVMYYAVVRNHTPGVTQTALFLFLTPVQLLIIFSVRNRDHFWKAPRISLSMKLVFFLTAIISVAIIYLKTTQKLLSFSTLPLSLLAGTIALAVVYFLTLDIVKVWFYRTNIGGKV